METSCWIAFAASGMEGDKFSKINFSNILVGKIGGRVWLHSFLTPFPGITHDFFILSKSYA